MKQWAVFDKHVLCYIGLHDSEVDCWRIFLGWPDDEEIADAKRRGLKCERVSVQRHEL